MLNTKQIFLLILLLCLSSSFAIAQSKTKARPSVPTPVSKQGSLLTEQLASTILRENKIGLDPNRSVKVYLPPAYAQSGKSYPVVYFCHNIFWSADKMFEDGRVVQLLERAFANGVVQEFILVVADYSSPTLGSLYENSPISGRWIDFTVKELVPFIDSRFRTIRQRDSRALVGEFMGGRGALKLAMQHAELFGAVYALHPVATGNGQLPWPHLQLDWKKMHQAQSFTDLAGMGREQIFVRVSQAYLPNPNRPPFYCDFFMELENGEPRLHVENSLKAKKGFLLDESLEESAANLRSLRGIAFDWGRFDPNYAHIVSNQEFSRKLEDLGIEHEAEEYCGDPFSKVWADHGRFYARVLPFLARHLVFDVPQ